MPVALPLARRASACQRVPGHAMAWLSLQPRLVRLRYCLEPHSHPGASRGLPSTAMTHAWPQRGQPAFQQFRELTCRLCWHWGALGKGQRAGRLLVCAVCRFAVPRAPALPETGLHTRDLVREPPMCVVGLPSRSPVAGMLYSPCFAAPPGQHPPLIICECCRAACSPQWRAEPAELRQTAHKANCVLCWHAADRAIICFEFKIRSRGQPAHW